MPIPSSEDAGGAFLNDVERAIKESLEGRATPLGPALAALSGRSLERASARIVLASDAKRARALLCVALGEALDVPRPHLVQVSAAIEMIHGASLLHDDVVDVADRRRNVPTVNRIEGNAFAVLAGDLTLTRALALLAALPQADVLLPAGLAAIEDMSRAALLEVDARRPHADPGSQGIIGTPTTTLKVWRHMAAGKTGALFGLAATLVCRLAPNASPGLDVRLAAAFTTMGVAFQIVDDLKDLAGADAGKPRGQDPRERALNHPLLLAATRSTTAQRAILAAWQRPAPLADDVVDELCRLGLIHGGAGAVDEARQAVQDVADALAMEALPLAQIVGFAEALVASGAALVADVDGDGSG